MKVLGVTGSIGMGKSTVDAMLKAMSFPVHDADATVRTLLRRSDVIASIAKQFPEVIDQGIVIRSRLALRVFTDSEALKYIEALLHPLVLRSQEVFLHHHRRHGGCLVALDIPLLFETHAEASVDAILVVTAAEFIQRARVLGRPTMTVETFQGIIDTQLSDKQKCRRADFIINTGAGHRLTWCHLYRVCRRMLEHGTYRKRLNARNCSRYRNYRS